MTRSDFTNLLDHLVNSWSCRNYSAAASVFDENVHYTDPLRYSFQSRSELQAFYEADEGYPQRTVFHTIIFDEERQIGAAEYTYEGTHRYHGVTLVHLQDDKVISWREYQHVDPRDWEIFISGKAVERPF